MSGANYSESDLAGLTEAERAALAEDEAIETEGPPEADDDSEAAAPEPIFEAAAPADAGARLARIEAYEEAITEQYESGDITSREMRAALRQAADARNEVQWAVKKAELANEMHAQASDRAWWRDVNRFMSTTASHITTEAAKTAFDLHVRKVTGDPANARLSNRAMLEKAYKSFQDELAEVGSYQASGHGGAGSGGGSRDFAALDRLADKDPLAYERALASMSADERNAYLGG